MRQVPISEAASLKYPEWVVFVVTRTREGQPNLMPAGWCMFASGNQALIATAIGHGRYTHDVIAETQEFVISWAGEGQAEVVAYAGTHSGAEVDKFSDLRLQWQPGVATRVPLVEGCAAHLECKLYGQHQAGDHTIFVGEVVAAHVPDEPIRKIENFGGEFWPAVPDRS